MLQEGERRWSFNAYLHKYSTGQITSSGGIAARFRENTSRASGKRVFETSVDAGQGVPSLTHH